MNNDVKDVCDRLLEGRPALPTAEEVLERARSADRRRTVLVAAGSGMAAVAVVAAAAIVWQAMPGPGGGIAQVGTPPDAPSPSPSPSAAATGRAAVPMAHGKGMSQALIAALPQGFTGRSLANYDDAPATVDPQRNDGQPPYLINASVMLTVTSGNTSGSVTAYIARDKLPDPAGDLCAPEVATRLDFPAETCQVITVGTTKVRVTTATYPVTGTATSATIFLGDGWLTVTEHQRMLFPVDFDNPLPPDGDPRAWASNDMEGERGTPLSALPFTPQRLAEVCALPGILPS